MENSKEMCLDEIVAKFANLPKEDKLSITTNIGNRTLMIASDPDTTHTGVWFRMNAPADLFDLLADLTAIAKAKGEI